MTTVCKIDPIVGPRPRPLHANCLAAGLIRWYVSSDGITHYSCPCTTTYWDYRTYVPSEFYLPISKFPSSGSFIQEDGKISKSPPESSPPESTPPESSPIESSPPESSHPESFSSRVLSSRTLSSRVLSSRALSSRVLSSRTLSSRVLSSRALSSRALSSFTGFV